MQANCLVSSCYRLRPQEVPFVASSYLNLEPRLGFNRGFFGGRLKSVWSHGFRLADALVSSGSSV